MIHNNSAHRCTKPSGSALSPGVSGFQLCGSEREKGPCMVITSPSHLGPVSEGKCSHSDKSYHSC